jgi:hypothetical protein
MNACIFLRNMIIESECANPNNDNHRYDLVGPLATIDLDVPADFLLISLLCTWKSDM